MPTLQLLMNENLFVKDPQETELGRKIVRESIALIDELGFEGFTFKRLTSQIDSTEASIYRYFENKHRLLVYIIAWYWNWMEYKIDFGTQNIDKPEKKLAVALHIIAEKEQRDPLFPDIDEEALYRIVISESEKTYLTKQVDKDNKEDLFRGFKSLCHKIAGYVKDINPSFKFPYALISTALKAAHQQVFYAIHLPALTDIKGGSKEMYRQNEEFLKSMIFNSIK